ncbi:hypothetical protein TUM17378_35760 [Shewanella algae]|nr:hypothetical protein TUM17378_35760 [Shewanella algae]
MPQLLLQDNAIGLGLRFAEFGQRRVTVSLQLTGGIKLSLAVA